MPSSGAYADGYTTEIPLRISQAQFIEAFHTTVIFKVERLMLKSRNLRPIATPRRWLPEQQIILRHDMLSVAVPISYYFATTPDGHDHG